MKSNAANVPDYLASLPPDRRAPLEAVRKVIRKNLDKDYEECMVWGVAAYTVPQRVYPPGHHTDPKKPLMMCGLSSQKNDMVVYLMNVFGGGAGLGGDESLRDWFEKAWAKGGKKLHVSGGGCCVRFKKLDDLALDVIGEAIARTPARVFVDRYVRMLAERGGKKVEPGRAAKKPAAMAKSVKKKVARTAPKKASAKKPTR